MPQVIEIDELDAGQCLATLGRLRVAREGTERDILLLCAHFADLYNVDARTGVPLPGRGRERPVRLGGTGVGVRGRRGRCRARHDDLVGEAADGRRGRRPPPPAPAVGGSRRRSVLAGLARKVAQATRELTVDQAAGVDEQMVGYADGRLPFSRFMSRLEGLVVAADPVAAAARERKAREEEFAKVGQSNDHGQRTLYVRTGAAQMARIDATIAFYSDVLATLGDTDPLDKRRSKAVLLLANPTQAVALLQALAGQRDGLGATVGGDSPDSADSTGGDGATPGDRSGSRGPATGCESGSNDGDRPYPNRRGTDTPPPPPPPPDWDELDLDLPPDDDLGRPEESEASPGDESEASSPDRGGGTAAGTAKNAGGTDTGTGDPPDDGTGPPDAAEAFLRPFFTPFRPTSVPPCACQGGGFLLDAAAMLPEVTLYLHGHVESLARGDGVVRWEGVGPITGEYLRTVLGPHARFTVKPVVDPQGVPPADGYEVPARMAEALHLRTPFDVFPFGASTARDKQKDHTVASDFGDGHPEAGQTGLHNLGGMTTFHHRVKTHGRWQVRQPFPGVYLWKSPHGSIFYVDNTGTRRLSGPTYRRRQSRRGEPVTPEGTTFRTPVADVLLDESPSLARFRRFLDAS